VRAGRPGPSIACAGGPRFTPILLFTATAPTDMYALSLHDALPIFIGHRAGGAATGRPRSTSGRRGGSSGSDGTAARAPGAKATRDRKSTRLNSSHVSISYAVFCLKKKKERNSRPIP